MTERDNTQGTDSDARDQPAEGQVSEVSGMGGEPDAISPSDATAGTPEGESGEPQEGAAGPNAKPAENVRDSHLRDG